MSLAELGMAGGTKYCAVSLAPLASAMEFEDRSLSRYEVRAAWIMS